VAAEKPDLVDAGNRVFAGTINGGGALEIQVTRTSADSTLARVVKMVNEAETNQSPTQRLTDRFERIFVPAVVPGMQGAPGGEDEIDIDTVEVAEGESLEDIKAKLKPKKQAISAEMLDTANTYDDKVAVIRMIVSDEAGRVSNVFKSMMSKDMG